MNLKFLILSWSFSLCILNFTLASAQESMTITTYYPSPFGSYNQLQASSLGIGDNDTDGNIDSDDVPTTAGDVWIAGNVGIGTINPQANLHIMDSGSPGLQITDTDGGGGRPIIRFTGNDLNVVDSDDTAAEIFGIYSTFSSNRNNDAFLRMFGDTAGSGGTWGRFLQLTHDGTDGIISTDVGDIAINPADNLGIGTTAPPNKLHVVGAIGATSWIGAGCEASCETAGGYSLLYPEGYGVLTRGLKIGAWEALSNSSIEVDGPAQFHGTAAQVGLVVNSAGRVGIGVADPDVRLDVSGNLQVTGWAQKGQGATDIPHWDSVSDIRLKKNIKTINDALGKVLKLRGVYFEWKDSKKYGSDRQIGLIAQEVEEVFPDWVSTMEDGYKSIAVNGDTALFIEAIKELKSENDTLKQRIKALEEKIK